MPFYTYSDANNADAQTRVREPAAQHSKFIYRDLEDDLEQFIRNVPPVESHMNVYSTKLWSILVRACAEIDSQLHSLTLELDPSRTKTSYGTYKSLEHVFQLKQFCVLLSFNGRRLVPFNEKLNSGKPEWWIDYNEVKHRRLVTLESATLENSILAVAALYIVLVRQFGDYLFPPPMAFIGVSQHQLSPSKVFGRVHRLP